MWYRGQKEGQYGETHGKTTQNQVQRIVFALGKRPEVRGRKIQSAGVHEWVRYTGMDVECSFAMDGDCRLLNPTLALYESTT